MSNLFYSVAKKSAIQFLPLRLLFLLLPVFALSCTAKPVIRDEIFIRVNQLGYFPEKLKNGIVFSKSALDGVEFNIVDAKRKQSVHSGTLQQNLGTWGDYPFHYSVDFTGITASGEYYLEVERTKSHVFAVDKNVYASVADSVLEFFKIQRCGPTNPKLHKVCHLYDSPMIIGDPSVKGIDVTGGWHDAGDYTKFVNTTAYATYMLLFSYQLNRPASEFDNNRNGEPDILEEARVGLDWLLRCNYSGVKLVNQVQNNRDHEVGWRMPENDPLKYERPAFAGIGKNIIGIYCAALSLGAKIWIERFSEKDFSAKLRTTAEKIYAIRNTVPDVDSTDGNAYEDTHFAGKLCLGAYELYSLTGLPDYLGDALQYISSVPPDYWWSWGDIGSLAHFRMASYAPQSLEALKKTVLHFSSLRAASLYNLAPSFSWGTTTTMLGVTLQALLLRRLQPGDAIDSLAVQQMDYFFGKNPWGISFLYGFGKRHTLHFHSQVAHFNKGYYPGAIAAGPAPASALAGMKIERKASELDKFNSSDVKYYDDRLDYITNEPTIVTNATAMFVFLDPYFRKK